MRSEDWCLRVRAIGSETGGFFIKGFEERGERWGRGEGLTCGWDDDGDPSHGEEGWEMFEADDFCG